MKIFACLGSLLLFCSAAFAGVTLVNDSSYKLTVHIRASDGTDLGGLQINPQQTMSWTNYKGGTGSIQYYDASQTPYTVIWFCNNGSSDSPYSIWTGVSSGSVVTANGGDGLRSCQAPKKQQQQSQPPPALYPQAEQNIQKQTEQSAGPPEGMLE
jgi:hypothetical protein